MDGLEICWIIVSRQNVDVQMISVYFDAIIAPPFDAGVFRLYLLNESRKIATEMKRDFDRTVSTWDTKPKFTKEVDFGAEILSIEVGTDDDIYRFVSDGTDAKPRVARGYGGVPGAKAIKMVPYSPKTFPGNIDATAGGETPGSTPIYRRYALNAGKIRPRDFDGLIQELWNVKFAERMQKAVDNAAIKTGYVF